jgi:uncharacterized oxidoreductase
MKTTNNTILITGGSAGIGFAVAKTLSEKGNQVIITGRNAARLEQAAAQLKNVTAIVSDVTSEQDVQALVQRLKNEFPQLNMVINNAGNAFVYQLDTVKDVAAKAKAEMETNFFSILHLNEQLLPLLREQPAAAIVNVSSIVSFAPSGAIPGYSASKAALHSYTQALRLALKDSSVKVFELMPPLVNTEFSAEIGGADGIPPQQVADDLLTALGTNDYEIRVGKTADLYKAFLSSPEAALEIMNTK